MLIAIEGCIGAGKSTVAKGLVRYRQSEGVYEEFESNPFLKAFYKDPVTYALETEFSFLLIHYHQIKSRAVAPYTELICDFHLSKDLIYADLNLEKPHARQVFQSLYDLLIGQLPPVELMICLSASNDLLIKRIRQRNRDFELQIDEGYYHGVNAAYEVFFNDYKGRKIDISMDAWDFIEKPELYGKLSEMIDKELK